jgi:hypothetical protein
MSKEILQRVRLLMKYNTERTLSENISVVETINLTENIFPTIVKGTAKGTVDDILKRVTIIDDAGKSIVGRKNLLNFLEKGSKPAVAKAIGKLNTEFLRSPGVLRASKSMIIDDMVTKPTFIKQFAGKTTTQIKNELKSLGYADDIASEIARKTSNALKTTGTVAVKTGRRVRTKPKGNYMGISASIWSRASKVIGTFTWVKFLKWAAGLGISAIVAYALWTYFTGEKPTDDDGKVVPKPRSESTYMDCTGKEILTKGCKSSDVKRLQKCIGVDDDGAWGPKTQSRMVELGLGSGISVSDIDQICRTQSDVRQDAELRVQRGQNSTSPRVSGRETEIDVSSNQSGINIDTTVSTGSVDDFS